MRPRSLLPLLLVLLAACHESSLPTGVSPNDPRAGVAITGRVLDFTSGVPMSGVEVVAGGARATTDANGHYALIVAPPESTAPTASTSAAIPITAAAPAS